MLLTKRIATLLHHTLEASRPIQQANLTPGSDASNASNGLHTLLLLSPTGKLLSSSSPQPTSTLRTWCTVACSLWGLYTREGQDASAFNVNLGDAVAGGLSSEDGGGVRSILVQLENGIMVLRMLRCGLLFVAVGGSGTSTHGESSQPFSNNTTPIESCKTTMENGHDGESKPDHANDTNLTGNEIQARSSDAGYVPDRNLLEVPSSHHKAPSDTASVHTFTTENSTNAQSASTGSATNKGMAKNLMFLRRQAEEFSEFLDDRLESWGGAVNREEQASNSH